jgi:hypothetical protein
MFDKCIGCAGDTRDFFHCNSRVVERDSFDLLFPEFDKP